MLRSVLALLTALIAVACVTVPAPHERHASANSFAAAHGWTQATLPVGAFDLAAWLPQRILRAPDLTIYVEGDGLAWSSSDTPSLDPTPVTPVALQLALAQPDGNAAYLARACQYVGGARCERRYWTAERFAPEVVAAANAAVDALKVRFGAQRLTLVGYSGGGAIAALLAERRDDVARLVTVAGNLDHRTWSAHHHLTPLVGSLDPMEGKARIASLPQWHFAGERDNIVPPFLAQGFAAGLPAAHVVVVEGYDHKCCWADNWPTLWKDTH